MREDQREAIERLERDHFPGGIVVLAPMPDGSLHTYLPSTKGNYAQLLDHLSTLAIDEVERLASEDEE